MNRQDFQALAVQRAGDATSLLHAGRWSGAYYLAGYAVECGLKACIAKRTKAEEFPSKDSVRWYTHDLETLVVAAELKGARDAKRLGSPKWSLSWSIVGGWKEDARYKNWDSIEARSLVEAVVDPMNGVLPWIMAHW